MTAAADGLATACRSLGVAPLAPLAAAAGITRLADLTGLDRLGIAVVQAVRPAARSLAVTMGKGAGLAAAATGAIMEAAEQHCAELAEAVARPLAAAAMPPAAAALAARLGLAARRPVGWIRGLDLVDGGEVAVPLPAVTLDFTRPERTGIRVGSNGLAAGATRADALLAAMAELVERDRFARWLRCEPPVRAATAIDPATIGDPVASGHAAQVAAAGCTLLLWDLAAPGGLPVVAAAIVEAGSARPTLPPAFGIAARFDPAAAAASAIAEAAQTRAGLIAGARDDLRPRHYAAPAAATARVLLETLACLPPCRPLGHADPALPAGAEARLGWLVAALAGAGGPVVAVDLARPEIGVPVVKVLAPALAGAAHDLTLWRRAA